MTKEELDKLGLEEVPEPPKESYTSRIGETLKNLHQGPFALMNLGPPSIRELGKGITGRIPGQIAAGLGSTLQYASRFAPTEPNLKVAPEYRAPTEQKFANIGIRKIGDVLRAAGEAQQQKYAPVEGYAEQFPAVNWLQQKGEGMVSTLAPSLIPGAGMLLTAGIAGGQQGESSFESAKQAHPEWTDEQALQASVAPASVTTGGFLAFPALAGIGRSLVGKMFPKSIVSKILTEKAAQTGSKEATEAVENLTLENILQQTPSLTQRIAKNLGGATADTLLMQAQSAGTVGAEKITGARPDADIMKEVVLNPEAWGAAFIMGAGFQGMTTMQKAATLRSLRTALNYPKTDIRSRVAASRQIYTALQELHPEYADVWADYAARRLEQGLAIPFDTSFAKEAVSQQALAELNAKLSESMQQYELSSRYPGKQPEGITTPEGNLGVEVNTPAQDMLAAIRGGVPVAREGIEGTLADIERNKQDALLGQVMGARRGVNREIPAVKEGLGGENAAVTREGVTATEPARTLEDLQGKRTYRNEQALAETPSTETNIRNIEEQGKVNPDIEQYFRGISPEQKEGIDRAFAAADMTPEKAKGLIATAKEMELPSDKYLEAKAKERFPDISFDLPEKKTGLPLNAEGRVEVVHYSNQKGLAILNPDKFGTGLKAEESKRKANEEFMKTGNWKDRTSFGVVGEYPKEAGLGPEEYRSSFAPEELYDFNADPQGLIPKAKSISEYERLISEAANEKGEPYKGFYIGNQVRSFVPKEVQAKGEPFKGETPLHEGISVSGSRYTLSEAENKARNDEIAARLQGKNYRRVEGYYKGSMEESFILPDTSENRILAKNIAAKYGQESIMLTDENGKPVYRYADGRIEDLPGKMHEITKEEAQRATAYTFDPASGKYFTNETIAKEQPGEKASTITDLGTAIEKKLGVKPGSIGLKKAPNETLDEGVRLMSRVFGKETIPVDTAMKEVPFYGVNPEGGNTIYIHVRGPNPQLTVFGHELIESMFRTNRPLYDEMMRNVGDIINTEDLAKTYSKVYSPEDLPEGVKKEAVANYVGHKFTDPAYLIKIGNNNPTFFQKIINFISELLHSIRNSPDSVVRKAWVEGKFADLQKVEDATAKALAEFQANHGAEMAGATTDAQRAVAGVQWAIHRTDSPFFQRWGGKTKVLDAEGKPLLVYHGSDRQFTSFDPKLSNISKDMGGFWFASDPNIARRHGDKLISAYLNIKNPLPVTEWWKAEHEFNTNEEFVKAVEAQGYDGLEMSFPGQELKIYVALRPEQIKSVTNSGEFNPETADIRFNLKDHLSKITEQKDVKEAADTFKSAMNGMKLLVHPESLSEGAQLVADVHRSMQGEMNQNLAKAYSKLDSSIPKERVTGVARIMDAVQSSSWLHIDKVFNKMSKEEADGFRQWMDTGVAPPGFHPTETLVNIGAASKEILADYASQCQDLGIGYLDFLREFYWPHYRNVPTEGRLNQIYANISKRPSEGAKKFAHERIYDDYFAFQEAGIENLYTNPLDEMFAKIGEMGHFLLTHRTAQTVYKMTSKDGGEPLIFPVKMSEATPADHTDLTYRFSKGFVMQHISPDGRPLVDEAGRPLDEIRYRWVMRNDVAPIFENYLAKGLYGNKYIGKPFEMYMSVANTMNQWQLGMGSFFHGSFTSFEAIISHQAIGLQQISEGKFAEGLKTFIEAPKQLYRNPIIGNALYKLWKGEGPEAKWMGILSDYGVNGFEATKAVEMMGLGGFRATMDARFVTNHTQKMMESWANGEKGRALLRSPFAFVEQTARPIMEWLVPRQKIGVFAEEVFKLVRDNPTVTHEEMLREANIIMNRIDSRLGQANYDRLYVRPVTKNIIQALIRAPGWTGGTVLEIGGGIVDAVAWTKGILSGNYQPMSRRTAYTVSLIVTTAAINGLLTYIFTGEAPDEKDMFAFRTGEKDEQGRDQRFMLPTYMKDIHAWFSQPEKTFMNKLHPALGMANDLLRNKDYYGTEIVHPDDSIFVRTIDNGVFIAKQFVPFWMRGIQKEVQRKSESSLAYIGPLFGVMPAPSDFYMSPAERHMYEVMASARGESKQTREEFQRKQIVNQLVIERRRGEDSGLLASAKNEGILRPRDIKDIAEKASKKPFIRNFTHMRFQDAAAVYELASPEEKEMINAIFIKKLNTFKKNGSPEEIEDMREKYSTWNW